MFDDVGSGDVGGDASGVIHALDAFPARMRQRQITGRILRELQGGVCGEVPVNDEWDQ